MRKYHAMSCRHCPVFAHKEGLFDDEIVYRETLMIANGPYKPLSSQINGKKSIAHLVAFIDFVDWYSV